MPNHQQLHIHNIYIPPRSRCSAGHNASIAHLLSNNEMSLIVGDINTHHSRWDMNTNEDEIGEQLADEIDTAVYTILNENEATRLTTNGRSTSPNISLTSNDIALLSDWSVSTSLASDHLSILITIKSELSRIDGPRRKKRRNAVLRKMTLTLLTTILFLLSRDANTMVPKLYLNGILSQHSKKFVPLYYVYFRSL